MKKKEASLEQNVSEEVSSSPLLSTLFWDMWSWQMKFEWSAGLGVCVRTFTVSGHVVNTEQSVSMSCVFGGREVLSTVCKCWILSACSSITGFRLARSVESLWMRSSNCQYQKTWIVTQVKSHSELVVWYDFPLWAVDAVFFFQTANRDLLHQWGAEECVHAKFRPSVSSQLKFTLSLSMSHLPWTFSCMSSFFSSYIGGRFLSPLSRYRNDRVADRQMKFPGDE